jgi:hypothetical protein
MGLAAAWLLAAGCMRLHAPPILALTQGLTGHFAIPTVILGGNDSFHFAFHPEKDGNVRMAGLSSLQKMEISIL